MKKYKIYCRVCEGLIDGKRKYLYQVPGVTVDLPSPTGRLNTRGVTVCVPECLEKLEAELEMEL